MLIFMKLSLQYESVGYGVPRNHDSTISYCSIMISVLEIYVNIYFLLKIKPDATFIKKLEEM
jgi:hypothetical protein